MYSFEPIGIISSCFKQRFGIPRQSGLVPNATGIVKLRDEQRFRDALKDLEMFSHLWIVFVFHDIRNDDWKPRIRPPRLGGSKKVGVLASRSPHRPNPIGISAVEMVRIDINAPGGPEIHVRGIDMQDETPILDIKPYIPYADSIPAAKPGWSFSSECQTMEVKWTDETLRLCAKEELRHPGLKLLIEQTLAADPRPPYQLDKQMIFRTRILDLDVHWEIHPLGEDELDLCTVVDIKQEPAVVADLNTH